MNTASKKSSREGAAYGLQELGGKNAIAALLVASRKGVIRWNAAGGILAGVQIESVVVIEMLRSGTERDFRVATGIVEFKAIDPRAVQWTEQEALTVASELETTLNETQYSLAPSRAKTLREWISSLK